MKIENIKINKFGCHQNVNLDFTQGINVIKGNNESGKSTLLAFVRAVLYGFDSRASENPRKKYLPWGSSSEDRFGGELTFTHHGKMYRAVAVFTQSKRTDVITLYNDVTGEVISLPDGCTIGEHILGLSSGAFDCSVFAAQLNSKGDFGKDRNGQLFTKLSNASNSSTESSAEANRRLKKAIHQITNRSGEGTLDRLYRQLESAKAALNLIENSQAQVGQLSHELEQLTDAEEKLKNRRNYYMQFSEIKRAFGVLDSRKSILRKAREIEDIDRDIESMNATMDPSLYDDIKPERSGVFIFLFILMLLLFGAGVFGTVFTFLETKPFLYVIGCGVAALLFLLGSIICLLKIRVEPEIPANLDEEFQQLEYLKLRKQAAEEELTEAMEGMSWEELEGKWQTTAQMLEKAQLTQDTLQYIRQCPIELLNEKTEATTTELMSIQQRISYVKGNMDTMTSAQQNSDNDILNGDYDVYEKISDTEEQIKIYRNRLDALYLAQNVLEQSAEELQNTFGPVINRYTQKNLAEMTGKQYGNIRITSDFQVSVYDSDNMAGHNSSDYSGATEDQIYLALRFALTSLISAEGEPLPLYLDDPFVQYDDSRYYLTLQFIKKFTDETGTQIVLATCQNRDLSPLQEYNQLYL